MTKKLKEAAKRVLNDTIFIDACLVNDARQPRTEAMAAIYETMLALYQMGAVSRETMIEFDNACLI